MAPSPFLARSGGLWKLAAEAAATFEIVGAAPMLARTRALLEAEMVRNSGADGERAIAQSSLLPSQ